jgi:hypothetical protein
MATQSVATRRVRPWVMTTPLGRPVVPEVKRMSDGSSGPSPGPRSPRPARVGGPTQEPPTTRCRRVPAPGHHDGRQVGQLATSGGPQHGDVVGVEEVGDRDQHLGLGSAQGCRPLRRPLKRVLMGTSTHPAMRQAEQGHHPLDAVERPDGHPVAGLDAGRHQRGAERAAWSNSSA